MRKSSFWLALFTVVLVGTVVLMTGVLPAQARATGPQPRASPAAGSGRQGARGQAPARRARAQAARARARGRAGMPAQYPGGAAAPRPRRSNTS